MEKLIQIAIKGDWKPKEKIGRSYTESTALTLLDPLFFQALGKECGWDEEARICYSLKYSRNKLTKAQGTAMMFYEINLTESFDSAINYLLGVCEVKK